MEAREGVCLSVCSHHSSLFNAVSRLYERLVLCSSGQEVRQLVLSPFPSVRPVLAFALLLQQTPTHSGLVSTWLNVKVLFKTEGENRKHLFSSNVQFNVRLFCLMFLFNQNQINVLADWSQNASWEMWLAITVESLYRCSVVLLSIPLKSWLQNSFRVGLRVKFWENPCHNSIIELVNLVFCRFLVMSIIRRTVLTKIVVEMHFWNMRNCFNLSWKLSREQLALRFTIEHRKENQTAEGVRQKIGWINAMITNCN